MKRIHSALILLMLAALLLTGCRSSQPAPTEAAPAPAAEAAPQPPVTEAPAQPEAPDAAALYASQLQRYHTALTEQWEEGRYFETEMSHLAAYYYEGQPLENVGYAFPDMDADGSPELIIGAIAGAQQDPAVFEIWTLAEGEPVMLVQSGSRNRYFVEQSPADGSWQITNDASNGAANSALHTYVLHQGALQVTQGVVLDALASPDAPWFLAADSDWDVSNDTPIDEATAMELMQARRDAYTVPGYTPFSQLP